MNEKLLAFIIDLVLAPKGNQPCSTFWYDMVLIYALRNGIQLHPPTIFSNVIIKAKWFFFTYHYPFTIFLSNVFQHCGMELEGETAMAMKILNKIRKVV